MSQFLTLGISYLSLEVKAERVNLNNLTTEYIIIRTIRIRNNKSRMRNWEGLEPTLEQINGLSHRPRRMLVKNLLIKSGFLIRKWQQSEDRSKKSLDH